MASFGTVGHGFAFGPSFHAKMPCLGYAYRAAPGARRWEWNRRNIPCPNGSVGPVGLQRTHIRPA